MLQDNTYKVWLSEWKARIKSAQIKAAIRVNTELLGLYWSLGRDIVAKQEVADWGDGLIPRLSKDLKQAFPDLTGFSRTNLFYIRKWFLFYREYLEIVQQVAGQSDAAIVQQVAAQLQGFDKEMVDLKAGAFKPEYAGKLNFYCSVVDDLIRTEPDQATIGLLLCREAGKRATVEYALRDMLKPLGVAEYVLTDTLPDSLKGILPTTEELEQELDENF